MGVSTSTVSEINRTAPCVANLLLCLCFLMTSIAAPIYASVLETGTVSASAGNDRGHHVNVPFPKFQENTVMGQMPVQSTHVLPCDDTTCGGMHNCADNCPMNTCCMSVVASPTSLLRACTSNYRRCQHILISESPVLTRTTEPLFRPPIA